MTDIAGEKKAPTNLGPRGRTRLHPIPTGLHLTSRRLGVLSPGRRLYEKDETKPSYRELKNDSRERQTLG